MQKAQTRASGLEASCRRKLRKGGRIQPCVQTAGETIGQWARELRREPALKKLLMIPGGGSSEVRSSRALPKSECKKNEHRRQGGSQAHTGGREAGANAVPP